MNYYVIGIGGTGAKCVEAFIHLLVAGLLEPGELFVIFVDPDQSNGNVGRAQTTLTKYIECKRDPFLGETDLFKIGIRNVIQDDGGQNIQINTWSPINTQNTPSLERFFDYGNLPENEARLFDTLFSSSERITNLDIGFRGHPSIGAAVLAKTLQLCNVEPWTTFRNLISNDINTRVGAKIFLFGSIFGGTGASGFPTIARLIRNEMSQIGSADIGGALVLPYFSFTPPGGVQDNSLRARSEDFLINTKAALKYYYQRSGTGDYDAIYLIGDDVPMDTVFCIGGQNQQNKPHFVELYAALAAVDFFSDPNQQRRGYFLIARENSEIIEWEDLPYSNIIKTKIRQLVRFAFAYLSVYLPAIEEVKQNGRSYRFPWFVDFFEKRRVSIYDPQTATSLRRLKEYCESFLEWISAIHSLNKEQVKLVNCNAFKRGFKFEEFDDLILPTADGNIHGLDKLWRAMCKAKKERRTINGIIDFIQALYRACGN